METEALKERLSRLLLFHALDASVLDKFVRTAQEVHYSPDEILFEEGAPGDSLLLIVDGSVMVQKRVEGHEDLWKDLGVCEAGTTVGEMALVSHHPRSARVRAIGNVTVLRIWRRDFERFLAEDGASACTVLGGLLALQAARLRDSARQVVILYDALNVISAACDVASLAELVTDHLVRDLGGVYAAAFCL